MVLDSGTSADAAESITRTDREKVRAAITVILRESGPLIDEQIVERYAVRASDHSSVPWVTPQRIRTVRAELVRNGHVKDAELMAFTSLGHRATAWTLT